MDFLVRMANIWELSTCKKPHAPSTPKRTSMIIFEANGDALTLARLSGLDRAEGRIHAVRTVGLEGVTVFAILSELPVGRVDDGFFPAFSTIVSFEPDASGRRRIRAVGIDWNSSRCRGWIFDAVEA